VLVFVWQNVQPPWWELAADFGQMLRNQQSGSGYEGTDEYVPLNADPYQIKKDAPLVAFYDSAVPDQESQPRIQQWSAESKTFTIATSQPERLVLRLFNYPAWRVAVNGRAVATTTRDVTGQMLIPVQAGENQVQITFARTWDRTLGGIISSVSALFVGGFVFIRRRRSR